MSYKEKPQIKLYKYENSAFVLQAIIDDYQEVSFNHSLYEAGEFSITINYNIPNALKFERGLWVQFGNEPYAFGEILKVVDSIGADGKGSQLRVITGHDARYIFKRRIIKNLNNDNTFSVTGKGEECIRSLVNSQCGINAEKKRQLPIINNVDFSEHYFVLGNSGGHACGYNKKLRKFIATGSGAGGGSISVADGDGPFLHFIPKYSNISTIGFDLYCGRLNVVVTNNGVITSPDAETWTPKYTGTTLLGITYSEKLNRYIACGVDGKIVVSSNGETWAEQNTGASVNLWGITYSEEKELFVIVGNEGTILTSSDGETWTSRTSGVNVNLRKVIYAEGKFVAIGYSGTILESEDVITWETLNSGVSVDLNNICYLPDSELFYIVGNSGTVLKGDKNIGFEKKNYNITQDLLAVCEGDTIIQNYNFKYVVFGGGSQTDNRIIGELLNSYFYKGEDFSVSEAYTNLYDVLVTTATQSKTGWRIKFENNLLFLECFIPQDLSSTVQFTTDFDSLSNGEFNDSSESYANSIFVGGKGTGSDRDIYEGEQAIDGNSPAGMERFEAWDNQSAMTTENEYEAEALAMLTQYGQTLTVSGNGLAKSPYVFKEEYNVGDTITLGFSGKSAKVQILNITEHWGWGAYDLQFNFGKPQNDLGQQLQLILRQIQKASNKTSSTDSVHWYEIPIDYQQDSSEVIYNTIGFIGNCASGGSTFKLYLDDQKTGAKNYHVYFKQLGGGKLTLTTGKAGATNLVMNSGTYVAIIYVDALGNVSMAGASVTNLIESGNNQPASSNAVYQAIQSSGSGIEVYDSDQDIIDDLPNLHSGDVVASTSQKDIKTGVPLGTWASFVNDSAPNGEWLESGSTFNENTYPALAMMLGGNVVPTMYDHNRPSAWEDITLPTSSASAITMEYDGQLWLIDNASKTSIYVNGIEEIWQTPTNHTAQLFITFQKGDVIYASKTTIKTRVQYYKHPMFIKATPTSSDTDYQGTLNGIRTYVSNSNSYSTEEVATGGKWIDGKPIYRRVFHFDTTCTQATNWALPYAEKIVNAYLTIKGQSYACCSPYTFVTSGTSSWGQAGLTVRCSWSDNSGWSSSNGEVIFEYTKSTDI